MKTKNTKAKKSAEPKIKETTVDVKVAANPEQRTGLRGLKGLVFDRFATAFAKSGDLKTLPTMEDLSKEVAEKFPQSRWLARPKVHYSYYKSKFISSLPSKSA